MASLVCATCRKLIPLGTNTIRCTVASCNTGRMKLRFCSEKCWQKHVPTARHRKASFVVEGVGAAVTPEPEAATPGVEPEAAALSHEAK